MSTRHSQGCDSEALSHPFAEDPDWVSVLVDDGKCILETQEVQKAAFMKCEAAFQAAVQKDPSKICPAMQTLVDCYDSLYAKCGPSTAISLLLPS